ncbi:MAG: C4-dicarboxylate ABC transporter permease [Paracoccus denitrificans]|nr:MAG: C4-dicarboxylate ABC transporter permease [Paracoccus denitrificans]PZO84269.1 MAG: C4-dicarboxylate ABC transporter permease [Paracoccus denitrificans]
MITRLENVLVAIAAVATILMGLMITISVIARFFGYEGVPDLIILVREMMIVAVILPLAAATSHREHIAITLVSDRFNPKVRGWLIVFGEVFGLLALAPLIYAGWRTAMRSWRADAYFYGDLNFPQWPGEFLFVLGLAVCWLRLLTMVFQDISTLRHQGSLDVATTESGA